MKILKKIVMISQSHTRDVIGNNLLSWSSEEFLTIDEQIDSKFLRMSDISQKIVMTSQSHTSDATNSHKISL